MSDKVQCATHGETDQAFVCSHLAQKSHGLGFNCEEASSEVPFPDAWCDDCEIIRAAHNGWTDEAQGLVKISLVCTKCYERARIRNTRPPVTLDDLTNLRWKCHSCEEWHYGPCLDFACSEPYSWSKDYEKASRWTNLIPRSLKKPSRTFLDLDYCAIEGDAFFVRGNIHLPIIGTDQHLCWGVWGSLSRANFDALLKLEASDERAQPAPMFSWLNAKLPHYPDTLNLKMYAHIQKPGLRPQFELELTDHPLSQEYHYGILPERVRGIMLLELRNAGQREA